MSKQKVCRTCKAVYEGDKCPKCDSSNYSDSYKGRIIVLNPEKSEIAKEIKITKEGTYAIKI